MLILELNVSFLYDTYELAKINFISSSQSVVLELAIVMLSVEKASLVATSTAGAGCRDEGFFTS